MSKPNFKQLAVFSLLVITLSFVFGAGTVSAWTGYPPTNVGLLPQTNWTDEIDDLGATNFNASSSKYVVFNNSGVLYEISGNPNRSHWLCTNTSNIEFVTISGDSKFRSTSPFNCYILYVDSSTMDVHLNATSVSGSLSGGFYSFNGMDTIAYAVNTNFNPNYESSKGVNDVPLVAGKSCAPLEFSCWMGSIAGTITGGLSAISEQILRGFAFLFSPDSQALATRITTFQTYMNQKLGFLTYPFVFFSDLFTSFTSGSSWCTESSCAKSFGNLWGTNVSINLIQLKTTMPALWDFSLLTIRGLLVFGLIYGLRKKYMEVVTG